MTLPKNGEELGVKLRTIVLTMLTTWACAVAQPGVPFPVSATGLTSMSATAAVLHPATAVDVQPHTAETGILPGPFGLVELTSAYALLFDADSSQTTGYGLSGVAGSLWYDLGISVVHARHIGRDADVGITATAGLDGGADMARHWHLLLSGGLRWRVDSMWLFGVSIANALTLGVTPTPGPRLAMGVGMAIDDLTAVTIDASMEATAGLGIIVGVRHEAHPRVTLRAAVRTRPACLTTAVRCQVATSTSVLFDLDLVTVLGVRTRLGFAWQL